jgi:hypothetical protein
MTPAFERRLLQVVIAVAAVVPVSAGLWGALGHIETAGSSSASQARYLSGLLLGLGLIFWACIPTIERRGQIVRALATMVVIGGLARLAGAVGSGLSGDTVGPLVMELAVTPLVALWRERVERRLAP